MYAAADADDQHHASSAELLQTHDGPLILPTLVVGESAYMLATRLGVESEAGFLQDLGEGSFEVEPVTLTDWRRMAELVLQYGDMPLGSVDAAVIATAERLLIGEIATLDRRHFTVVRPYHVDYFTLLP